jgi:hypothetical protein
LPGICPIWRGAMVRTDMKMAGICPPFHVSGRFGYSNSSPAPITTPVTSSMTTQ